MLTYQFFCGVFFGVLGGIFLCFPFAWNKGRDSVLWRGMKK